MLDFQICFQGPKNVPLCCQVSFEQSSKRKLKVWNSKIKSQDEILEKSLNATSIALIPKKFGTQKLKDFRPLSLIGEIYKVISKLLTERQKTRGETTGCTSSDLLQGRQNMAAAFLANELVDSKSEMEKAWILKRSMTMSIGLSLITY